MKNDGQSGQQFLVVFEQSPIGIVVMDAVGRIQYVNASTREFLGYTDRELCGGFLTTYSHEEDSEFFQTLFAEIVEGDRDEFQVVSRCKLKNGAIAWWRVDMRALRRNTGAPFMVAVIGDITSQKNDEEHLRRAKNLAETATRTKSAFLANMSHEIRTPLHTIKGMSELLRETGLDEEQLEYLHQIRFAGEVLLGLINDILDFSKIEAGRLQFEEIRFEPVTMIEDAVDMVSLQAHRKGLEVVLQTDRELPRFIVGDPNRIRQVIVNLVNNAVKFTESGFIRISAEFRRHRKGVRMLVQVKDTGIGIPEERQNRLFKPFSQVDASMTRKFGGTGLGLSISRDLVELMGGKIGFKSKEGIGSNFWFALPLTEPSAETNEIDPPRGIPRACRCLIVDDNIESRRVLAGYLDEWGVTVAECTDGGQALEHLKACTSAGERPDIVFIDLRLPSMDGWQLASEIRNEEHLEELPLVLMSPTGVSSGDAKMKLLRWFKAYINKPVKPRELQQAFESVFTDDIEELEALDTKGVTTGISPTTPNVHLPETVLVVEDHFVNQQLFRAILEKNGFRTLVASDGVEAVEEVARNASIGLIFMDVQMPNLNGYDATTRIREMGITTPIVAITANALSDDRERCVRAGMNEYMSKPSKKSDIDAVLERLIAAGFFRNDPNEDLEQPDVLDVPDVVTDGALSENGNPPEDAPPMDVEATIDTFMGNVETAERVSRSFAEKLPDQINHVRSYINKGKIADARVVIHAIKGGAWSLNCFGLGDAARIVEDFCANENRAEALSNLGEVENEAERFRDFIANLTFPEE